MKKRKVWSHQIKTLGERLYPIELEVVDNSTRDFADVKENVLLAIDGRNFLNLKEVSKLHKWLGRYLEDII